MKELIRVRVQYASRQQCCKTHKRPLPLPFTFIFFRVVIHFEVTSPPPSSGLKKETERSSETPASTENTQIQPKTPSILKCFFFYNSLVSKNTLFGAVTKCDLTELYQRLQKEKFPTSSALQTEAVRSS